MEKLRVHGKLLEDYIRENRKSPILKKLQKKYLAWAKASDTSVLKNKFIDYSEFFDLHSQKIRSAIGSERKFATFVGYRFEEFIYLLFAKVCKKKRLMIDKIPPGNIISWIGFNLDEKFSIIGHGADLAIGQWRKFTIKNGLSVGIEEKEYFVPVIIIECKYYVSLDMFRDIVTESEMFKRIYPYSLFIIVCEIIEMTEEFKKMKKVWEAYIDNFFAFRPGNRKNPGKLDIEKINTFEKFITDHIQKLPGD